MVLKIQRKGCVPRGSWSVLSFPWPQDLLLGKNVSRYSPWITSEHPWQHCSRSELIIFQDHSWTQSLWGILMLDLGRWVWWVWPQMQQGYVHIHKRYATIMLQWCWLGANVHVTVPRVPYAHSCFYYYKLSFPSGEGHVLWVFTLFGRAVRSHRMNPSACLLLRFLRMDLCFLWG